jgi:hypothetical protein
LKMKFPSGIILSNESNTKQIRIVWCHCFDKPKQEESKKIQNPKDNKESKKIQKTKKKKNQKPYVSRTDQNSIKKTQEKLRQDNGMQIQKCSTDTMSVWMNDLPSWESLSLKRKNSDLHSIKSATINYNLGLIIES